MNLRRLPELLLTAILPLAALGQDASTLGRHLAFHASFDKGFDADFSRGENACTVRQGKDLVPAKSCDEVRLVPGAGRFGGALWFTRKAKVWPQFRGEGVLGYNATNWSASVSVWLRLDPDKDLEPGYCDPVQVVGDDGRKGFIFLEWSKDETPRFFRYAIRPLFHIWNPDNRSWGDIPVEKRPMIQVARAPFSRETWTHVVFTLDQINSKAGKPQGALYLNGQRQGRIENWDLTFGWDPRQVQLVLGAAYVGYLDELAVFDRALTDAEVKQVYRLEHGIKDLHP